MDLQLQQILISFGINIASNVVYDFVKASIEKRKHVPEMKSDLGDLLGSSEAANKVIEYLEESRKIKIQGYTVFAGTIDLHAKDADEAIGAHLTAPTVFMPGSSITVKAENVKSVTGLKVENIIK